ncbi:uncharacterized protein CDV56_106911 [Aspergillus thermomutatus]|uniref:Mid2 domain-containing protein n=1 Tax=Aspergillus thermomutatus TaxID=41047 RepID=A0A397HPT1_ASPTH|nr:uncharacterized protein CDV56_106911 [Aspergillus thermomutatus]RHZ63596.1 hypothetical protein CDV56_106911 [Aspergillus thermomutatus]
MAPLSPRILSLAIGALALTPLTSAWTLTWRNSTAGATIIEENKPENCTRIWHQEGEAFSWDPEGKWCMHFYKDAACSEIAGLACDGKVWRKDASRNLSAFDVYPMPPDSVSVIFPSTSSTTTTSSPSHTPTSTAVTTTAAESQSATSAAATTTPTGPPSSTSLSGGAIAGIVIGALAALAVLGALFFFLGKRNRKAAQPENPRATSPQTPQFPPGSPLGLVSTSDTGSPAPAYVVPHKQELAEAEMYQASYPHPHPHPRAYAGSKFVELPGNGAEAELSNSRQVHEMDGTSDIKRPVYEAA